MYATARSGAGTQSLGLIAGRTFSAANVTYITVFSATKADSAAMPGLNGNLIQLSLDTAVMSISRKS